MTSRPAGIGTADVNTSDTSDTDARTVRDRADVARAALARAEQRTGARRWSAPFVDETAVRAHLTTGLARGPEVRSGVGAHRSTGAVVRPVVDPVRERPPLPVPVSLTDLLPEGLPRGGTAVVAGSTSLLWVLLTTYRPLPATRRRGRYLPWQELTSPRLGMTHTKTGRQSSKQSVAISVSRCLSTGSRTLS